MSAQRADRASLWSRTRAAGLSNRFLSDATDRITLAALDGLSLLGSALPSLQGASVLIWSATQLPAVRALIELDGVAGRVLLAPPDLAPEHLPAVMAEAAVDVVVFAEPPPNTQPGVRYIPFEVAGAAPPAAIDRGRATGWILLTSGTTGRPKLVEHSLESLSGPLAEGPSAVVDAVWSTFYDVRRYGGLQILLRALLGGGSLVVSAVDEPVSDFLGRAGAAGVTHMLGTPTHWRRALMSPELARLAPRYVRLSGEIADQAVLTQLAERFPHAGLTHAFASTEAGVGFEVTDRLEGFPASVLGVRADGREIRIVDGSLRVRSSRTARRYLGGDPLVDRDGFIDTGDMVVERAGRFYFAGRRSGVINVGGQKVHPEEVEAVILRHPAVRVVHVRGRRSPIVGMIVVADIVLQPGVGPFETVRAAVLEACRAAMPAFKVPAMLTEVSDLAMAASGKLERRNA